MEVVDGEGRVADVVESWDRDAYNRFTDYRARAFEAGRSDRVTELLSGRQQRGWVSWEVPPAGGDPTDEELLQVKRLKGPRSPWGREFANVTVWNEARGVSHAVTLRWDAPSRVVTIFDGHGADPSSPTHPEAYRDFYDMDDMKAVARAASYALGWASPFGPAAIHDVVVDGSGCQTDDGMCALHASAGADGTPAAKHAKELSRIFGNDAPAGFGLEYIDPEAHDELVGAGRRVPRRVSRWS